tara:strand:- start:7132 stop:7842 length:711 start_codon:yes stop_codon:yes gene_type:complete
MANYSMMGEDDLLLSGSSASLSLSHGGIFTRTTHVTGTAGELTIDTSQLNGETSYYLSTELRLPAYATPSQLVVKMVDQVGWHANTNGDEVWVANVHLATTQTFGSYWNPATMPSSYTSIWYGGWAKPSDMQNTTGYSLSGNLGPSCCAKIPNLENQKSHGHGIISFANAGDVPTMDIGFSEQRIWLKVSSSADISDASDGKIKVFLVYHSWSMTYEDELCPQVMGSSGDNNCGGG